MDLRLATIADILLLIMSLWCILAVSDRSIFNPSLWWVGLHTYTVTFRLITVNLGVESPSVFGVQSDIELVNAALASDISLLAVVAATLLGAYAAQRNEQLRIHALRGRTELDPLLGQVISVLCIVIGTYALLKFGYVASATRARGHEISAIDIGQLETSAYPIVIAGFAIQGALLQFAIRGFTFWSVALFGVLVVLTSVNSDRSSFVLALIMAFLIYQTRRNRTDISATWVVAALLPLALVWFVFKPIAGSIQRGSTVSEAIENGKNYFSDSVNTESLGDTEFLDMQASYMAASDEAGKHFYGATLLPLLYIPIPRYLWPEKPRMNDWELELASKQRPFFAGMVATFSGDSYVNFGWLGCAGIPFLYMALMQAGYRRAKDQGITSSDRWIYLICLVTMIQAFRDGMDSVFTYPFIAYLPLTAWALISKALGKRIVLETVPFDSPTYVRSKG